MLVLLAEKITLAFGLFLEALVIFFIARLLRASSISTCLLGRVEFFPVDCKTVEELQAGQLAQDEVDLVFPGQADEEHLEAAETLRVRGSVQIRIVRSNQT